MSISRDDTAIKRLQQVVQRRRLPFSIEAVAPAGVRVVPADGRASPVVFESAEQALNFLMTSTLNTR